MKQLLRDRTTRAYALLVSLTVVSYAFTLGNGDVSGKSDKLFLTGILVLALAKVRLIMLDFMELRTAPWRLRLTFELGAVAVIAALLIITYAGA